MKRYHFIFYTLIFTLLVSCTNAKPKDTKTVNVDKGLFNVTITIPASMLQGQNIDQVIADAKKKGMKVTKNPDGSLTYKMSKAQHEQMMKQMKAGLIQTINETKTSKDYKSIKDITYNNDFSEFTMTVDQASYQNSMDGVAALTLGMSGMMYQLYNGENPNTRKVTISVKDQTTQKVFDQIVYPDALKQQKQ